MMEKVRFVVTASADGSRVDRFLRDVVPGASPKSIRFALESAGVTLATGLRLRKGDALSKGDEVVVRAIPDEDDWLPVAGPVDGAVVIYEDPHLLVLDKPVRVHTEPQRPLESGTLAGHLRHLHPEVVALNPVPGLTLLSRLDFETSGAVVAALTAEGFARLSKRRAEGMMTKHYLCLVDGVVDGDRIVRHPISTEGGEMVRVRTDREEGDPSFWTGFRPLEGRDGATLLLAEISQGKRHQIRAHLASIGHPIVGDPLYGRHSGGGAGAGRMFLHAWKVIFEHPVTGEKIEVESPPPPEFAG